MRRDTICKSVPKHLGICYEGITQHNISEIQQEIKLTSRQGKLRTRGVEHVSYIHKCTNKRRTQQHIRRKYKNCKHQAKQNEQTLQRHMKLEILTSVKAKEHFQKSTKRLAQTQRPLAEGQLIMRPITSTISKQQNQDSIRHSQPDSVMSTSTPGLAPAQPRADSGAMAFCQAMQRHQATQTQRGEGR
jgi:hypothetical protein